MSFWNEASPAARKALIAASLGWLLDAFDVMLYALILTAVVKDLNLTLATGGQLASLTLAASALGGLVFGVVADKLGRTRALSLSILLYSVFTFACGLAQNVWQLALFRFLLGLGMGGEWASGATLVSETWPEKHRGKALGIMQSCWAIGYGAAAIVVALVLPTYGWRAVFFVGIIPAIFTLWIRRNLEEPEMWTRSREASVRPDPGSQVPDPGPRTPDPGRVPLRIIVTLTLMNAATMFAWWGLNLWVPSYLSLPIAQGGIGLSTTTMSMFIVAMQVGMWLGYVTFGFISDRFGRRPTYVTYLVLAAALVWAYGSTREPVFLLVLGPFVAFFGTGYFSGFGAVASEIFPTAIRATALGVTYNSGRLLSAAAPFVIGSLAQSRGFGLAFTITAFAFLIAALLWIGIPETRGRRMV
ncbi:MAG: MFS transporter [Acidobacterium sp.]|nr:MFS transporter [Acidobacteriota bacterium]PHY11870.1 MAG: MFS transporter [Acidobacterium sp.]